MIHREVSKVINREQKMNAENQAPERKFSGLTFLPVFLTVACILLTVLMATLFTRISGFKGRQRNRWWYAVMYKSVLSPQKTHLCLNPFDPHCPNCKW